MSAAAQQAITGNPAPAPYSTVEIGDSNLSFHAYITDKNGRKIGVAWGPVAEKVWTAALFAASPTLLAVLKLARGELFQRRHITISMDAFLADPVIQEIDGAIAKAEGR